MVCIQLWILENSGHMPAAIESAPDIQQEDDLACAVVAVKLERSDLVQHQVSIIQQFRKFWKTISVML
jgi:urease alpha subunit